MKIDTDTESIISQNKKKPRMSGTPGKQGSPPFPTIHVENNDYRQGNAKLGNQRPAENQSLLNNEYESPATTFRQAQPSTSEFAGGSKPNSASRQSLNDEFMEGGGFTDVFENKNPELRHVSFGPIAFPRGAWGVIMNPSEVE